MAYDDAKLPRAVMRGEELFVGDDKEPYFRDPTHTFDLIVTDLNLAGGFEPVDDSKGPKTRVSPGLRGIAKLEGRNRFAVAGYDIGKNDGIEFHLRTVDESETRFHWAARIGYNMYDLEMDAGWEFYVQGYCTPAEFECVAAAIRTGAVERLRVNMSTTMWTKRKSNGFMPGMPMVMHVAPPIDKESATPATESGFIRSITWEEIYGVRTPPPPDDDELPKPTPVELPARAYSTLTAIVGLLAALVVLAFLRR
jgi:hypothetical protein